MILAGIARLIHWLFRSLALSSPGTQGIDDTPDITLANLALLRRAGRPRGSRGTVLVTMGGSDPSDATNLAVRALRRLEGKVDSTVVVGRAYPFLARLRQEAQGTAIDLQVDPKDIAAWMGWADVAITAGGSTCWELALVGVPMILVVPIEDILLAARMPLDPFGIAKIPDLRVRWRFGRGDDGAPQARRGSHSLYHVPQDRLTRKLAHDLAGQPSGAHAGLNYRDWVHELNPGFARGR